MKNMPLFPRGSSWFRCGFLALALFSVVMYKVCGGVLNVFNFGWNLAFWFTSGQTDRWRNLCDEILVQWKKSLDRQMIADQIKNEGATVSHVGKN